MHTVGKSAIGWLARRLGRAARLSTLTLLTLSLSSPLGADPPPVRTGKLAQARAGHTATLLADGTVLITGGRRKNHDILASVERVDPVTLRVRKRKSEEGVRSVREGSEGGVNLRKGSGLDFDK
jgi:hypothetical protein